MQMILHKRQGGARHLHSCTKYKDLMSNTTHHDYLIFYKLKCSLKGHSRNANWTNCKIEQNSQRPPSPEEDSLQPILLSYVGFAYILRANGLEAHHVFVERFFDTSLIFINLLYEHNEISIELLVQKSNDISAKQEKITVDILI